MVPLPRNSDPHGIANVLGIAGLRWMLDNTAHSPFHVLFGAPSCVPATPFESAGTCLDTDEIASLLATPGVGFLSELMNYPAVLAREPAMMAKLEASCLKSPRHYGLALDSCGWAIP